MHKFFCNYNNLTEKYELTKNKSFVFNTNVNIAAENNMLEEIRNEIQSLYDLIVNLKEKTRDNDLLNLVNETELLISNLYYSFFASPLELPSEKTENLSEKEILTKSLDISLSLEKKINIPEYNRLCHIIIEQLRNIQNHLPTPKEEKQN